MGLLDIEKKDNRFVTVNYLRRNYFRKCGWGSLQSRKSETANVWEKLLTIEGVVVDFIYFPAEFNGYTGFHICNTKAPVKMASHMAISYEYGYWADGQAVKIFPVGSVFDFEEALNIFIYDIKKRGIKIDINQILKAKDNEYIG